MPMTVYKTTHILLCTKQCEVVEKYPQIPPLRKVYLNAPFHCQWAVASTNKPVNTLNKTFLFNFHMSQFTMSYIRTTTVSETLV